MNNQKSNPGGELKPGKRLGTKMRGVVADEYEVRGHGSADLVLHYSPKTQREVVLKGKQLYLHFLHVESDAGVVDVDYSPASQLSKVLGSERSKRIQAVLTMKSGEIVWRRVVEDEKERQQVAVEFADVGSGVLAQVARIEILTQDELINSETRIRNTHRAVAWIAAVQEYPLTDYKRKSLDRIKKWGCATFEEILQLGEAHEQALLGAAVLSLALTGVVHSQLSMSPLSQNFQFSEVSHEQQPKG